MQEVGKPIVLNILYEIQDQVDLKLTEDIAGPLMDECHSRVGEVLAKEWNLPEWLVSVMHHHLHYEASRENRDEVMVGHLAHRLACWAHDSGDVDAAEIERWPVCRDLGLSAEDVREIVGRAEQVREMAALYS